MQLETKAAVEKRQADAFDPTPARRKMWDDRGLELASQVPGPGEYTPRLSNKDSATKTFGSGVGSSIIWGSRTGSPQNWSIKDAKQTPGPASYSPQLTAQPQRSTRSSTFGLPPHLSHGRVAPSAHDATTMVAHLRALPAPDAYSPRDPMAKHKGFRIKPSTARSKLEDVMLSAARIPGPGTYEHVPTLKGFNSTYLKGRSTGIHEGDIKSDMELGMERARTVPGPGAYEHFGQLRSVGAPKFGTGPQGGLIEAIQKSAATRPGPDAYHPSPTFAQEQQMRRYRKAIVEGDVAPTR